MKSAIVQWLLLGALSASASLNVYHAKPAQQAAPPIEPLEPAVANTEDQPADVNQQCCVLVKKVQLSPDQKRQFVVCCEGYTKQQSQIRGRVDELIAKLDQELAAATPDRNRVNRLIEELGAARTEELKNQVNGIMLVRKVLTPEQIERLTNCCGGD